MASMLAPGAIVMECAGHNAIREYGETILQSGMDLVVASVGALADEPLAQTLESAANDGGQLLVPSGAVAGIDGLLAARTAGLKRVTYTSSKPPAAWKDTPAEQILNLDAQSSAVAFFDGTARKAAKVQHVRTAPAAFHHAAARALRWLLRV
jgi:aspartate dehydrogenase